MIERIEGMPAGTIGFRADGEITSADYREVLEPALREAVDSGEVRLLFVAGPDFEMDVGALREDAKTGFELGVKQHSAWKRTAVVTDTEWISKAIRLFAWLSPGEVEAFGSAQEAEARDWVAG